MHSSTISSAAALLAFAPAVMAAGTAHVINNCGFPIYYASVAQNVHAGMQELQGSYSESYGQAGVGVSIKLSPSMDGAVSQFEFTLGGDGKIYYDISNIDGNPFANAGMSLVPSMQSDASNPTCKAVTCAAGEARCDAAYNNPDDTRTTVCNENSDLTLTLCPGGSGTRSISSSDSASSPAVAASSPAASAPAPATPTTAAAPSVTTLTRPAWTGHKWHRRQHSRQLLQK